MNQIILLGPQRNRPTVATALKSIDNDGPIAVISAGWQEREAELEPLSEHLPGMELIDLRLYARAETVFEQDDELRQGWRDRQEWLKELQRLYRRRLRHALKAASELDESKGIKSLIAEERADAMAALRELDTKHLAKIKAKQQAYDQQWQPAQRESVAQQLDKIATQLAQCSTLLIAGGHVGVLINRLRLFYMDQWIGKKTLVAWSAGAMALSERIVLFHDFPPQGAGNPEVFNAGLAAYPDLVVFPDAEKRLALDDTKRVARLAERFNPATSVALDEDSLLHWDGQKWHMPGPTRVLATDGTVRVVTQ